MVERPLLERIAPNVSHVYSRFEQFDGCERLTFSRLSISTTADNNSASGKLASKVYIMQGPAFQGLSQFMLCWEVVKL